MVGGSPSMCRPLWAVFTHMEKWADACIPSLCSDFSFKK